VRSCYDAGTGAEAALGAPVWLTAPPAAPSAEQVAQRAVARLVLPQARIGLSPAGTQLVGLPVWLWLAPGSWSPVSATASVAGVSVTATARPVRARWGTGDGSAVVCTGAGTPWRAGMDPAAGSPDCGYRWPRSSAGARGDAYTLTVSVTWQVGWAGAGRSGTVAGLSTAATRQVRVAESQALIQPPGRPAA
jgi:hypothetical protein